MPLKPVAYEEKEKERYKKLVWSCHSLDFMIPPFSSETINLVLRMASNEIRIISTFPLYHHVFKMFFLKREIDGQRIARCVLMLMSL